MQFERFIDGRVPDGHKKYTGEFAEHLDQADAWSKAFADVLKQRLENPGAYADAEETEKWLANYIDWANGFIQNVTNKLIVANRCRKNDELLNRNNFHALNLCFSSHWYRLLTGSEWSRGEARQHNTEAQDMIALSSLQLQKERAKNTPDEYYNVDDKAMCDFRASIEGILNEDDSAIVLLEIAKKHPEIVVVPSPGVFEHGLAEKGMRSKNADFIIIDVAASEAIGAQVKGRVRKDDSESYDPNYVFFIDGEMDLKNTTSIIQKGSPRNRRTTRRASVIHAGTIAAHHVKRWPTKPAELKNRGMIATLNRKQKIQIQTYARGLDHRISSLSTYVDIIGQRALGHLYKNPDPDPSEERLA